MVITAAPVLPCSHSGTPDSLAGIIARVLACAPSAPAVEFLGRWSSWGELAQAIEDLRSALAGMGVLPGCRVGVLLRNRPPQLAATLTLLMHEYCLVTVNPLYPDAVLAADLRALDLPVMLGEAADLDRTGVTAAVTHGGGGVIQLGHYPGVPCAVREPMTRPGGPVADVAIEMLSSGTTGKPKRIPLSRGRFSRALSPAIAQEMTEGERIVVRIRPGCRVLSAPLAHIGGIWGLLRCVIAGRQLVLLEKFSLDAWLDVVRRHRPWSVGLPPAALKAILDADVAAEDLASLRTIAAGTAPTDPALIDAFWDRYHVPVLVNYGATEFGGPVANWSLADFHALRAEKRGSVGRLYPEVEARTVDPETFEPLTAGSEGALELRGPQFPEPEAWLRTTDLAVVDADRFLWIKGRLDGAIIRGGYKVHPEDVVIALEAHPAVLEAVVVGLPDDRLGAVPAAAVILRRGVACDRAELEQHLRDRLLPYQVPVRVAVWDDLPRTAAMKPALEAVRQRLAEG